MRVLRTEGSDEEKWTPRLCTHRGQPYAILSHRWVEDANHEVLFADIEEVDEFRLGEGPNAYQNIVRNTQYSGSHPGYKPSFQKVQGAAHQALKDGFAFIWIDTCCIDKNSSSELSEAINSMWMWYKTSDVCYVYLADVVDSVETDFRKSSWWTRGWTLQELLAPRELVFFTAKWDIIGPKKQMDLTISKITHIDPNVLNGTVELESVCIAQRMSWACSRTTTRIEDIAYCLLGLFGVNMPLLYGEGTNAFLRLQQEIIRNSDDETIFAWRDDEILSVVPHGLLASSPQAFAHSSKARRYLDTGIRAPFTMTNKGLSITATISRSTGSNFGAQLYVLQLPCPNPEVANERHTRLYLSRASARTEQYVRVRCNEWAVASTETTKLSTIYIKQHFEQRSSYREPVNSIADISLFRVLPTEDDENVRIELQDGHLETSRYSVISYLHDGHDCSLKGRLLLGDKSLDVNQNLFMFLQSMARSCENKLLWVDRICDPHTRRFENAFVMSHCKRIYASAQECIVWLGDINISSQSALRPNRSAFIGNRKHSARLHQTSVRTASDETQQKEKYIERRTSFEERHAKILSIMRDPYWKYASIILQLSLAQEVSIEFIRVDRLSALHERIPIRDADDLYKAAVNDTQHLHRSDLGHIWNYGLPKIDVENMGHILAIIRAQSRIQTETHGLLNRKPTEFRKADLDFDSLLTMFRYHEADNARNRVKILLAMSDLHDKVNFDIDTPLSLIFLKIARAMENKLNLTTLPKLLTALEISDMPTRPNSADRATWSELVPAQTCQTVHSLDIKDVKDDRHRMDAPRIDRTLTEAYSYCTLEPTSEVRGGLVFVKNSAASSAKEQKLYSPRCLYLRQSSVSTKCELLAIPHRYKEALVHTTAILEREENSTPRFVLNTDCEGLLALAFCMQENPGSLPKICERFESI